MKVRCNTCKNVKDNICSLKGFKICTNKRRKCSEFILEIEKVTLDKPIQATYVPWHLRSKKNYRQYIKEETKKSLEFNKQNAMINGVQYATPDCLSNYRATVLED